MDAEAWAKFWLQLEEIYQHEDNNLDAYRVEESVLRQALEAIDLELSKKGYSLLEPLGRGGAGVVIRVYDGGLRQDRALKLPRPRQEELVDSVRNEIDHLTQLHHDSLIHLHELGAVPIASSKLPYPYFVMDFVPNVKSLREKLDEMAKAATKTGELRSITDWLSRTLATITSVVTYLHSQNTIHFDIKPANILIDTAGKPTLSDLGFAKRKIKGAPAAIVGFTLPYAHPDLRMEYQQMSSQNRVRKKLLPDDFKFEWDIYAFGKTILEMLSLLDSYFVDAVSNDYHFLYLHLAACRMLDGRNLSDKDVEQIRLRQVQDKVPVTAYRETWLGLSPADFSTIAYKTFSHVKEDLDLLVHGRPSHVPISEIDDTHSERVQIAHQGSAAFTERVRATVSHPCFARLQGVVQLGFANTVYPGATHTRFEHSIGAYRNACAYVRSLLSDRFNPLFRQLASDEDLRAVVLAALLHDLGQFPLAHELEEVSRDIKHESLTIKWLDNPARDSGGRTLKDLIEDREHGWGVPIEKLKAILASSSDDGLFPGTLVTNMLSSLVDGPIDVDKLDYLVRDSDRACLPYGHLIDIDRLLKHLTIVIAQDGSGNTVLTLGTYEKGQSAAESATFARYLLYQALYWHRAIRAPRAMLREASKVALRNKKFSGKRELFVRSLEEFLGVSGDPQTVTNLDILKFIGKLTDDGGRRLVDMIRKREYYKRILTVHSEFSQEEGRKSLLDQFRATANQDGFGVELQKRVRTKLEQHLSQVSGPQASSLAPERRNKALEMLAEPAMILCDCPKPPYGSREKLRFIPEPSRVLRNYMSRASVAERVSEVWQQVFFKLMEIASKGRVYCHPEIRDTLMAALGPDGVQGALSDTIKMYG
jgi:HD superfamily phosphohydrolase/serine/threonine protein kinase